MSKEKFIVVMHYPATFSFFTNETITDFNEETGCSLRDRILHEELKRQKIDSPYHHYSEYTVEEVETTTFGGIETELWGLGS